MSLEVTVKGSPVAWRKRPKGGTYDTWVNQLLAALREQPLVQPYYDVRLEFTLGPKAFDVLNLENPNAADLDNLCKVVLDALKGTVFRTAPGGDSAVLRLSAVKMKVPSDEGAGVRILVAGGLPEP